MNYLKTKAIVLRSYKIKERDKYIIFFSKEYGKVKCTVRGISKIKHRYGSNIELFSLNTVELYKIKKTNYFVLTNIKLEDSYFNIRRDIDKYFIASFLTAIVNSMISHEGESEKQVFSLLSKSLKYLSEEEFISGLVIWFWFRLLKFLGYGIQLNHCVNCRKELPVNATKINVSHAAGGITCAACTNEHDYKYISDYMPITRTTLDMLKQIERTSDLKKLAKIDISIDLKKLTELSIRYNFRGNLKGFKLDEIIV
ncbi:DNA repair protein RecO [bacterium]